MSFDLSLARGLDYYTGLIYEAIVEGSAPPAASATASIPTPASTSTPPPPTASSKASKKKKEKAATDPADGEPEVDESTVGVGSIAGGGRYDELVGMFAAAASSDAKAASKATGIPCVGVSIGVERVFSILMQKEREKASAKGVGRKNATEVFVMSVGDGLILERMQIAKELWDAGIKVRFRLCVSHLMQFPALYNSSIKLYSTYRPNSPTRPSRNYKSNSRRLRRSKSPSQSSLVRMNSRKGSSR